MSRLRKILTGAALSGSLLAQQPGQVPPAGAQNPPSVMRRDPAKTPSAAEVAPDTIVATINGKPYTAEQIRRIVAGTPPQAQALFAKDPRAFLREHASLLTLVAYAEQNKLDKTSPYVEMLEFYRMFVLSNAAVNHKRIGIEVTPEEQRSYYTSHQAEYREARVRMIYFPFSDSKSEAEAKTKAAAVTKRASAGEDFVKLAKESSPDPTGAGADFTVRPGSSQPPDHMKQVLLTAKEGTVTEPLRHDNGYYVFRVEAQSVLPYEKVRDDIYKEIQNDRFRDWQQKTQAQASVKVENEAFFQSIGQQQ